MVQEVADNKMAKEKDATKEKKNKASNGKDAKDWKKDEISMLTKLLEERPILCDVFNKDYSKRDVKNTTYKEIADVFGCNIASIKGKINGFRAQYGIEKAKVNKTKIGQSTGKPYVSNRALNQSLAFFATYDEVLKQ